ncbi:carbonic anhydrase [Dictyobacter sp. S3.2.2.5]|uniref:carbonic anhydrase n=2 Tax=Dictyobacter halimunensis TaxID=3026934 RepID=A0ABQ6FNX9_9CHLR|nr:carbonic anhydrase [Dictyobacter sp. S3.2.2.5]
MITLDTLKQRNHDFAAHQFTASMSIFPASKPIIVSCVDPRADPAHILGLEFGDALVIRNIGGRFTPETRQTIVMLQNVAQAQGATPGKGNLIIMHHTDCGITRLAGKPDLLAHYFEIDQAELGAKAVTDPRTAVAIDVAAFKANPLPGEWAVSGLVYNVTTGLIEAVVTPDSLQQ